MALLPEIEKGADALGKRPPVSETWLPEPLLDADRASAITIYLPISSAVQPRVTIRAR